MWLDALDKTVAVQERAVWIEQIMDRPVTCENLFGVAQIVQSDGGDSEVEGAADLPWPGQIDKVAEDEAELIGPAGETLAGAVEHRLGIILQRDASRRGRLQHLFADRAISRTDVQHIQLGIARKRRKR